MGEPEQAKERSEVVCGMLKDASCTEKMELNWDDADGTGRKRKLSSSDVTHITVKYLGRTDDATRYLRQMMRLSHAHHHVITASANHGAETFLLQVALPFALHHPSPKPQQLSVLPLPPSNTNHTHAYRLSVSLQTAKQSDPIRYPRSL